jgi:hypothetical protein
MDGDVPMRHGWQSIGLGAVGFDSSALSSGEIAA